MADVVGATRRRIDVKFSGKLFRGERVVVESATGESVLLTSSGSKGWGGHLDISPAANVAEGRYHLVFAPGSGRDICIYKVLRTSVLFKGVGEPP